MITQRQNFLTVLLSAAAMLIPLAAFGQQEVTLDVLKDKFEIVMRQIESDTVTAYTNELAKAGLQLKQKADLDGYLVLQAEQKRFAQDGGVEAGLTNASKVVSEAAKKVIESKKAKTLTLHRQYVASLEALLKQLMLADRIEGAKEVKDVLDAARFELADLESKLPQSVQPTGARPKAPEYPNVAGTWSAGGWVHEIRQTGGTVFSSAFLDEPSFGRATQEGTGTISKTGEVRLFMRVKKGPDGWSRKPSTTVGQLSADGLSMKTHGTWGDNGEYTSDSVWTKVQK